MQNFGELDMFVDLLLILFLHNSFLSDNSFGGFDVSLGNVNLIFFK